jgi:hypothetical protein
MSDLPKMTNQQRVDFLSEVRGEVALSVAQITEMLAVDIAVNDERNAKPRRESLDIQRARLDEIDKRLAKATADLAKTGTSPTP